MERNRIGTVFGVVSIALACAAAVLAGFAQGASHRVLTPLLAGAVILAGLAALAAINFLMFVPLFTFVLRLYGKIRKQEQAEPRRRG